MILCPQCGGTNGGHYPRCSLYGGVKPVTPIERALNAAGFNTDTDAETFGPLDPHKSVLVEAEGLVHGARNTDYGHPLDDFSRTAAMVSGMLAHKLTAPLTAEEIGLIMVCVKLSRQINRPKRDNLVDAAGYAETVQWCIDERERRAT